MDETGATPDDGFMKRYFGKELDTTIFYFVAVLTLPFVVLGLFWPEGLAKVAGSAVGWICRVFQSTTLYGVTGFLIFCIAISLSPFGKVKLGKDDEEPEFTRFAWFSMLFAAGMGIGLIFWSVAEPMMHMASPPVGEANTAESAMLGLEIYFFHWGFHAWAIYAVLGMAMAYFQFRKGERALVSRCLIPIIGRDAADGAIGRIVDTIAIWATIFGVVTGLGIGAMQMAAGFNQLFGIPLGHGTTAVFIALATLAFIISAITGVSKGIKFLSQLNVVLMVVLLIFFIVFGPTAYIFKAFFGGVGSYLSNLPSWSFSSPLFENEGWTRGWTVFYWAFWIAWAPFVGAFIARISKGRTIAEFCMGVILLPPIFSFIFSTALGGTTLYLETVANAGVMEVVKQDVALALFATMKHLPAFQLAAGVAMLLIVSFLITSCDSATYIVTLFATRGKEISDVKVRHRITVACGIILGLLTIVFDMSGGLQGLKTATVVGGLPFMFIMFLSVIALVKDLVQSRK
ncbi:MAG: BCCT family transporter [Desulfobacterales bacterium]|nr:BCCT family transporter [Desulfobacterales bacterium]